MYVKNFFRNRSSRFIMEMKFGTRKRKIKSSASPRQAKARVRDSKELKLLKRSPEGAGRALIRF